MTILASDGARHIIKTLSIIQILGVTISGAGGTSANSGGVVLSGNTTKGERGRREFDSKLINRSQSHTIYLSVFCAIHQQHTLMMLSSLAADPVAMLVLYILMELRPSCRMSRSLLTRLLVAVSKEITGFPLPHTYHRP